jgi:PilZ domain
VPTHLPVRLRRAGREWQGALLSLSESGCPVRSPEPMELGAELELSFELPRTGLIETRAETTYQLVPDTGLVFQATAPALRRAILTFVEEQLAA